MSETASIQGLVRSIENIGKVLAETQSFWAKRLNVSVPQWAILDAISELDEGDGIPVAEVARRLRVDASFVTAQTKKLESDGYLSRRQSRADGRVVLMSLNQPASLALAAVQRKRAALNEAVFSEFAPDELATLSSALKILEKRFSKAPLMLALDS